ncbi:MAG: carboxy terminal-processing peptidase [Myxococcota bacterium]
MRSSLLRLPFLALTFGTLVGGGVVGCSPSPSPASGGSAPAAVRTPEPSVPSLPDMPAEAREPVLAQALANLLPLRHLRQLPVDDALSSQAFEAYLEALDGSKLLLLAPDVARLREYRDRMDDQLLRGDLVLARKGAQLQRTRRAAVAQIVADILSRPFDFSREETLETDVEKRDYAADEAALRDRWRRTLKLQALERITRMADIRATLLEAKAKGEAPGDDVNLGPGEKPESVEAIDKALAKYPEAFEDRERKVREELANTLEGRFKRLASPSPLDPAETFLNAVSSVYDPHTRYLAPADKANFDIQMTGSLEGIGAVLSEDDHYIRVREVVPGGASWRQGKLAAGDLILSVAQAGEEAVDVADMPIDRVVQMIRGKKGTVVTLTVRKPDDAIEVIAITRDEFAVEAAYARGAILTSTSGKGAAAGRPRVGYVYLPSFYGPPMEAAGAERNATGDVASILRRFEGMRLDQVVLDLRGNGGGYLNHAVGITGLFIPSGPYVQTRRSDGKKEVLQDEDGGRVAFGGHLVVMVDRFSASASEILAGALQDYERAVVVGTGPTHGKGTVQTLVDLDQGQPPTPIGSLGVLKLTIQEYFRVTGASTQWRGVVPDLKLPDPAAHIESGERTLDHSIPWSQTEGLPFQRWTHGWTLAQLAPRSAARVAADPKLSAVASRTAYLEERRSRTVVPLERAAWEARHRDDEVKLESLDPKLDEAPPRLVVKMVGANAAQGAAAPQGASDRFERWRSTLARDPWVDEAIHVLGDMAQAAAK